MGLTKKLTLLSTHSDWTGKFTGHAPLALRPATATQAAALLAHCASRRLAVVPQGGNTGLVGGGVPLFDEVVVSTDRMVGVTSVDAAAGTVSALAGTTLADVDAAAGTAGMVAPLDLGARASCAIGGNVATNAGGVRVLRYGSLRSTVLGLTAALPNGTVLDLDRPLRKDNTGYDLKQLLIGSEGTLALITSVTLATPPAPTDPALALLACPSWSAVQAVLATARLTLGEALSAAEFLDAPSTALAVAHVPAARTRLPGAGAPFYVLLEAAGVCPSHDAAKMDALVESVLESGAAVDGTRPASAAQAASLWSLREGVPLALKTAGTVFKYDVSVPVGEMDAVVRDTRDRVAAVADAAERTSSTPCTRPTVVSYGHLGDGNLHLNVSAPSPAPPGLAAALEPWVYDRVAATRGSISAEHGLGLMKASLIGHSKQPAAVALMRAIKAAFDPVGIMNPYKVLPAE